MVSGFLAVMLLIAVIMTAIFYASIPNSDEYQRTLGENILRASLLMTVVFGILALVVYLVAVFGVGVIV